MNTDKTKTMWFGNAKKLRELKMKVAFTDKERVLRSPYYKCNRLWDNLDVETQLSADIF